MKHKPRLDDDRWLMMFGLVLPPVWYIHPIPTDGTTSHLTRLLTNSSQVIGDPARPFKGRESWVG